MRVAKPMSFDPRPLPDQVVIPSDLHAARQVEEQILKLVLKAGYSQECAFAIRLALEEALVNAHKHGNCGNNQKTITISYEIDRQRVILRVRDQGPGFEPFRVPDPTSPDRLSLPTGRGIMLMRSYLDDLSYNDQGNEVQLIKERRSCPHPHPPEP